MDVLTLEALEVIRRKECLIEQGRGINGNETLLDDKEKKA
jgi:hypothetical protein